MLAKIKQFFSVELSLEHNDNHQLTLELAAAALMIELSRADYKRDPAEQQAIEASLQKNFSLTPQQLAQLIELAEAENQQATSLYQFTQLITEHYNAEQRFELIVMLWQVAIADGEIDKYEDSLIRKIAELIYVPHSEFIRAKLTALGQIGPSS